MSDISALLDMVARKGPILMRTGSLVSQAGANEYYWKPGVTSTDEMQFLELAKSGMSQCQIAKITGWTQPTVGKALRRKGYITQHHAKAAARVEQVRELLNAGTRPRAIASATGISESRVHVIVRNIRAKIKEAP